ncbi:MAG: Crp/Fnr family transcriptional regulator [Clostridia bacterium]|nr:Crp/Fnr family transcriptional regulator [Clostridia bacterium]
MPFSDKKVPKSLEMQGFQSFSASDFARLKSSVGAVTNYYMQGEKIFRYSKLGISNIAYISEGSVYISATDLAGKTVSSETFKKGDMLGELFGFPPNGFDYTVYAKSDCSVVFFDAGKLMHPCENMCRHHTAFLNELFKIASLRLSAREERLLFLGYKTLREKLSAYLKNQSHLSKSHSFDIPISQTELASYLLTDRSALARELSLMKSEGIINYKGKHFEILTAE